MAMKDQLEQLVAELLVKGVRYEDAQREFEKRFIAHAANLMGMHRNTLSRKMAEYRLRRSA
jgi:ActR/RegA family two-component response regulator